MSRMARVGLRVGFQTAPKEAELGVSVGQSRSDWYRVWLDFGVRRSWERLWLGLGLEGPGRRGKRVGVWGLMTGIGKLVMGPELVPKSAGFGQAGLGNWVELGLWSAGFGQAGSRKLELLVIGLELVPRSAALGQAGSEQAGFRKLEKLVEMPEQVPRSVGSRKLEKLVEMPELGPKSTASVQAGSKNL